MGRTAKIRYLVFTLFGCALLALVLRNIDTGSILKSLAGIKLQSLAVILAAGIVMHFINGLRINKALALPHSLSTMISAVHIMWINLLPFRSGEVSFLLLSRKYAHYPITQSVGSLGIIRLWDVIVLLLFGMAACIISGFMQKNLFVLTLSATGMLLIATVVAGALFLSGTSLIHRFKNRFANRFITQTFNYISTILSDVNLQSLPRSTARTGLFTLLYWIAMLGMSYGVLTAFIPVDIGRYIILFALSNMLAILPVHGFLNIGTIELVNAYLLTKVGIDAECSVITAVGFHIVGLLFTIVFGVSGSIALALQRKHRQGSTDQHTELLNGKRQ